MSIYNAEEEHKSIYNKTQFSIYPGSNGLFTASNVSPGRHVIRVVAKSTSTRAKRVLRSLVYVPEDGDSCHPYPINRGLNVKRNNATLEFASTGSPRTFECILDRQHAEACKSQTPSHACGRLCYIVVVVVKITVSLAVCMVGNSSIADCSRRTRILFICT